MIVDDGDNPQAIVLSELRTDEASAVNEKAAQKKKLNIPTPMINEVASYEKSMTPDFKPPVSYIRRTKKSIEDATDVLEYNLEHKDVVRRSQLPRSWRRRCRRRCYTTLTFRPHAAPVLLPPRPVPPSDDKHPHALFPNERAVCRSGCRV